MSNQSDSSFNTENEIISELWQSTDNLVTWL